MIDKLQYSNILQIQKASRQGRLVVFVGAGVSKNSGVPTWSTLIQEMKNDCGVDFETDELKIAQLYKDARGEKEFMDKVKEVLQYNKVVPNEIHKAILDLKPCHIITTNYDNLLEQEIDNEFQQFDIIREDKDMPRMSYPNSLIKMHGDFDTDNIVLTESDYYNYEKNFPLIRSFVLSLFARNLIVFLGFSFEDLNLKMILNDLRSVLHDNMQRVYLITDTKPSQIMSNYYSNKGINIVYLEESDFEEFFKIEKNEQYSLTDPKGIYLYNVLKCIIGAKKDYGKDIVSTLYSQLKECKDELVVVGDGLKYLLPEEERRMFYPHSEGLQLMSPYFKDLYEQLKTFSGRRKFILDHPEIDWKELKELAYNNYLYRIDDVNIVDPQKQYELNLSSGNFSALWFFYHFDFENLQKRLIYLRSRDFTGDNKDLEYPFLLYKLGNYYGAYQEYNKILPIAWKRKKYILYFICLYNLWSIRNGVFATLFMKDEKLAHKIQEKLSRIELDDVLSRLPISEGIRKMFQDLLSFRSLGDIAVETEDKREQIFQQRKSGEKGGASINSNIQSLLSKFERTFQLCNNNYIVCDNNSFYKSISYNTVCGILNSYATPDTKLEVFGMRTSKIDKLFSFCIFTLVFTLEHNKLKEVFRRYEIEQIELTEDAVEILNKYWTNLVNAKQMPFVDVANLGRFLENLIYVTSKVNSNGINGDNVYNAIINYWDIIVSFKINGSLLAAILSNIKPSNDTLVSILDVLIKKIDNKNYYDDCFAWLAHYMSELHLTYRLDISKLKKGEYSNELYPLYKVLDSSIQKEFSSYCQKNLREINQYLDFIVDNQLEIISSEQFSNRLNKISKKNKFQEGHCCWKLCKMRRDDRYKSVHPFIDNYAKRSNCMRFCLSPTLYDKKNEVPAEWILFSHKDTATELVKVPEFKEIIKQYLIENKYLGFKQRNSIVEVL